MVAKKQIELGDTARDKVSGYEGVVIGRHQWLYGCERLTLQAQGLHDGKPIEATTVDEPQAVLVARAVVQVDPPTASTRPGGPRNEPSQRSTPSRGR